MESSRQEKEKKERVSRQAGGVFLSRESRRPQSNKLLLL